MRPTSPATSRSTRPSRCRPSCWSQTPPTTRPGGRRGWRQCSLWGGGLASARCWLARFPVWPPSRWVPTPRSRPSSLTSKGHCVAWSVDAPSRSARPRPLSCWRSWPPVAALTQAAAAYGGTLLEGADYDWAEAAREELRRQAADVAGRLAELREQVGDLDGAIAALEDGARWDAYNEELHQRIMRLQAELGADPDEATERLLHELRRGTTTRR